MAMTTVVSGTHSSCMPTYLVSHHQPWYGVYSFEVISPVNVSSDIVSDVTKSHSSEIASTQFWQKRFEDILRGHQLITMFLECLVGQTSKSPYR